MSCLQIKHFLTKRAISPGSKKSQKQKEKKRRCLKGVTRGKVLVGEGGFLEIRETPRAAAQKVMNLCRKYTYRDLGRWEQQGLADPDVMGL